MAMRGGVTIFRTPTSCSISWRLNSANFFLPCERAWRMTSRASSNIFESIWSGKEDRQRPADICHEGDDDDDPAMLPMHGWTTSPTSCDVSFSRPCFEPCVGALSPGGEMMRPSRCEGVDKTPPYINVQYGYCRSVPRPPVSLKIDCRGRGFPKERVVRPEDESVTGRVARSRRLQGAADPCGLKIWPWLHQYVSQMTQTII